MKIEFSRQILEK